MFQACRPAGRRFYWVLAVLMAASGVRLAAREVSAREPEKPASYPEAKPRVAELAPRAALPTPQSGPTLTSVIDTVYTADGTPAQGVLIITWPAFVTASGASVAAGDLNVTLGANGALDVALAANAGSKPGTEKKDAAMLFLQNALSTVDAVAAREIVDPEKFKEGISRIIDGTVMCLNASSWCKQLPAANTQPSAR